MGDGADFFATVDVAASAQVLVALGGALEPATLISAYRAGCFPWPSTGPDARALNRQSRRLARAGRVPVIPGGDPTLPWCSPDPRAVLLADQVRVSRSLRQRLRHCGWTSTVDRAFAAVVTGCADRPGTWITASMQRAYLDLHAEGSAHSVEVWDATGALVGGLYGVLTGAVFSGESMFHRERDAAKVAVVDLAARLAEAGVFVIDTQQETAHLATLGQIAVRRSDYLAVLSRLRDERRQIATDQRPVSRLAATGVAAP